LCREGVVDVKKHMAVGVDDYVQQHACKAQPSSVDRSLSTSASISTPAFILPFARASTPPLTFTWWCEQRYTRRCTERHGQEPIEYVTSELKKAAKAEVSWSQLLLTPEVGNLMGPFESSRLDPLLDAVLGTGYKALTQVFVWNIPLRNADVMVLARYLENEKSTVTELEFMHNELSPFAFGRVGEALSFNRVLKKLSFLHNESGGNAGVDALCKGLAVNATVEDIQLKFCGIEATGAEAIA